MNFKKILFSLVLGVTVVQSMEEPTSGVFDIIISGDVPALKTYLQDHPEVNLLVAKDDFGKLALNAAVEDQLLNPNPAMISFLLDKGADINSLDIFRNTPLLMAMLRYQAALNNILDDNLIKKLKEIIIILLKRGADPDILNLGGYSARAINPNLIKDITK